MQYIDDLRAKNISIYLHWITTYMDMKENEKANVASKK